MSSVISPGYGVWEESVDQQVNMHQHSLNSVLKRLGHVLDVRVKPLLDLLEIPLYVWILKLEVGRPPADTLGRVGRPVRDVHSETDGV